MKILSPLVQILAASSALETLAAPASSTNGAAVQDNFLSANQRASANSTAPRQDIDFLDKRKGGGGGGKSGGSKAGTGGSKPSGSSSGGGGGAQWGVCGPVAGGATTLGGYGGMELGRRLFGSTTAQVTGGILGGLVGGAAGVTYCVVQEIRMAKDRKKLKDEPAATQAPTA